MKALIMQPSWHWGYPQPDAEFGYLRATYDTSALCACGLGGRQVSAFRMKRAPPWGNRHILQLNWVFDEFFVRPDVWEAVFAAFGIEQRPALLHATGAPIPSAVQLVISSEVDAQLEGLQFRTCPFKRCRGVKYFPKAGCRLPPPVDIPAPIFRSRQAFGDAAYKIVYVSMDLYAAIYSAGLRGASFERCAASL